MKYTLDIKNLNKFINPNDVVIKKLLISFATNIPAQLKELKQSAIDKDTHNTAEIAHKLKTPFLYFGLDEVAGRLENLEQNVVNLDPKVVLQEVEELNAIGNDCAEQAQQEIEKLS